MPEKVFVDIELNLPKQLEKDLLENERICTTCKGLGIVIMDNNYGLKEEPWIRGFPYKHQSLWPCPDCYNGVQKVCSYCGQPGPRQYIHPEAHCLCEKATNERNSLAAKKEKERWEKADKMGIEEAIKRFKLVFVDGPDEYILSEDIKKYLAELREEPGLPMPYVWGTRTEALALPGADSLIDDACENLHEEARDNISREDIKELQELLDQWTEEVKSETITYFPDYKIGILVE